MDNLKRLLGPAPSEIPLEAFLFKLREERNRVRGAINDWRAGVSLKPVREKKEKKAVAKVSAKVINAEYEETMKLLKSLGLEG